MIFKISVFCKLSGEKKQSNVSSKRMDIISEDSRFRYNFWWANFFECRIELLMKLSLQK